MTARHSAGSFVDNVVQTTVTSSSKAAIRGFAFDGS
jgi:hypothetical protein